MTMMRRLLLLHCFSLTAVALVHSFTAGPSSSSPSSRMAVVAGASMAGRQWQPRRPTTYLCTASKDDDDDTQPQRRPNPKTFREGEVLGLRLMQGGKHDDALEVFQLAMKLPGSRMDIVRTPNVSGPSPVGGSKGGTESRTTSTLDAYELQAGHYNLACAYARIDADDAASTKTSSSCSSTATTTSSDNIQMSIQNLRKAFEFGFANYNIVKTDIDLTNITSTPEYINLMNEYEGKKKKKKNGIKFW